MYGWKKKPQVGLEAPSCYRSLLFTLHMCVCLTVHLQLQTDLSGSGMYHSFMVFSRKCVRSATRNFAVAAS